MNNSARDTANTRIADLVAKIKAIPRDQYDYLEVKQLAEIFARHRAKMRVAVAEFRVLKASIATQTDAVEKLYLGYESMFLRDHVRDSWRLYRLVSNDFHMAYTAYMKAAKNTPVLPSAFFGQNDTTQNDTTLPQSRRNAA